MRRFAALASAASLLAAAQVGTSAPVLAQSAATTDRPSVLSDPGVIVARGSETMLGSELGAIAVVGAGGEPIGDVEDTILGRDGEIVALLVGVGGWFGLGEKLVAVPWERLEVRDTEEGYEIVSALGPDELRDAPAYSAIGP